MDLKQQAANVQTRQELAAFVLALANDYETRSDQWENDQLPLYLNAMAAWIDDMDGFFQNRGEAAPDQPTWALLASILLAAKIYE